MLKKLEETEEIASITLTKCTSCGKPLTPFRRIVVEHLGIKQFGSTDAFCLREGCSRYIDEKQIKHVWQNMSNTQVEEIDHRKFTDNAITNSMVERYGRPTWNETKFKSEPDDISKGEG